MSKFYLLFFSLFILGKWALVWICFPCHDAGSHQKLNSWLIPLCQACSCACAAAQGESQKLDQPYAEGK